MSLHPHPEEPPMVSGTLALSASSCAWMPLEGVAQQWASFASTFLTYPAFTTTSAVFSALALESEALQYYHHACFCAFNGDERLWRAADEQALHALQEASSQWLCALGWLERIADDRHHPLDEEEQVMLCSFFEEATTQLHRLGGLTQHAHTACVSAYRRCGMLSYEQQEGTR